MFNTGNLVPQVNFNPCVLTPKETTNFDALKTIVLRDHPFFSFILLERLELVFTNDVPTAATDGVAFIYMNPKYISAKPMRRQVFAFIHEIAHCIYEHLPRSEQYKLIQAIGGVRFDADLANIAQDARINMDLVKSGVGEIDPDWIMDNAVTDDDSWESLYVRYGKRKPPPKNNPGSGAQGQAPQNPSGSNPWHGASHDVHLPPPIDKTTGKPVQPDTNGMKETVIQAAGFAKAQGKMPAGFQRWVDAFLEPQVAWEDHLSFVLATILGYDELSYAKPHRRRMAISFEGETMIYPGRTGKSAGGIVGVVDTSGSMQSKEMTCGLSEFAGILDVHKPKWFVAMYCDAAVGRIDENIHSADDLAEAVAQGIPGGGGTDFRPAFDAVEEAGLQPAAMVFFTDGMGTWPDEPPAYPVIWVMTTDIKPPFGEYVRVEVRE